MANTSNNSMTNIMILNISDLEHEGRALSLEDVEIISALPKDHAVLIATKSIAARFLLDSDITTIGRKQDASIMLDDPSVSREHAKINRKGTSFFVEDSGSLNGTYLNNELIDSEKELQRGDEIQIGKYRFQFFPNKDI